MMIHYEPLKPGEEYTQEHVDSLNARSKRTYNERFSIVVYGDQMDVTYKESWVIRDACKKYGYDKKEYRRILHLIFKELEHMMFEEGKNDLKIYCGFRIFHRMEKISKKYFIKNMRRFKVIEREMPILQLLDTHHNGINRYVFEPNKRLNTKLAKAYIDGKIYGVYED